MWFRPSTCGICLAPFLSKDSSACWRRSSRPVLRSQRIAMQRANHDHGSHLPMQRTLEQATDDGDEDWFGSSPQQNANRLALPRGSAEHQSSSSVSPITAVELAFHEERGLVRSNSNKSTNKASNKPSKGGSSRNKQPARGSSSPGNLSAGKKKVFDRER